jgi:hypothetical protein
MVWSRDSALVASFSVFTIALIPILWIFILAAKRARWVVLVFGFFKIWLWAQPRPLYAYGAYLEVLLIAELALITIGLIVLFVPSSTRWLDHERSIDIEAIQ